MLNKNKPKQNLFDVIASVAAVLQKLLGWVLMALLLCIGIAQISVGYLSSGFAMVGLAVLVCPRMPLQENWRLLVVAVIGFLILFLLN
ncbi:hypothetical protein PCC9214_05652 [Planktothrix tepida]|uniref:Uncharacterized protein n=2 Tax=Planktothrix TaxID=54304 RepID=A0A1J1LU61_9CYAN|nr:hypothetical protein PCC9214_05652 [Planktothrix tepida]CUR35554.1 membrane hypothetical protein [Planktothrix tepida PCC 9214]